MTEFEKLGGTYRQAGDYYLPNLEIDNQIEVQIGVLGQRHRRFLKENHRVRYLVCGDTTKPVSKVCWERL